jgi:hypothetical protein
MEELYWVHSCGEAFDVDINDGQFLKDHQDNCPHTLDGDSWTIKPESEAF